jgi:hypothetical protein
VLAFVAMAFIGSASLGLRAPLSRSCVCPRPRMQSDSQGESTLEQSSVSAQKVPQPGSTLKTTATWANTCHEDFPFKGAGSQSDGDLRPSTLRTEGAGTCDMCKGTGKRVCSLCLGRDYLGADGSAVKCAACNGVYGVQCGSCYGSGKQVDIVRTKRHPSCSTFRCPGSVVL